MKKIIMMLLLLAVIGSISAAAETWEQYIRRVETMTRNFNDGINTGHPNTWAIDKWGALMATVFWLEGAYENIYRNAPNLSQQQREIYRRIWNRYRTQSDNMTRLLRLTHTNANTRQRIVRRWEYWERHLNNRGTIRMN